MKFVTFIAAAALLSGAALAADSPDKTFLDLEQAWGNAFVKKDIAFLSAILADDWSSVGTSGKHEGKASLIDIVKSGKLKITAFKARDVKVRMLGTNYAVVQGFDDETSSFGGKDDSGTFAWTDVFEKRGGKWVAVNSQVTKVKK
jgi:hypothetical protein